MTKLELGNIMESWTWCPNEYIRFLRQTEAGSIYRVRAIHVTKTRNQVEFTEDELKAAARSLGYRPLNLNHTPPDLPFPENRVIDAEYEDAEVEALITVRDPSLILLIETKKIVAVSIECQYRYADLTCDDDSCWYQIHGVIFRGLALLTPGVEPGDPLASIVMKKTSTGSPSASEPASFLGTASREADTKLNEGGVIMEKKEATPPPEPNQQTTPISAPQPEENRETEHSNLEDPATAKTHQTETRRGPDESTKAIIAEVKKIGTKVDSLEDQVKLLKQRRKGTRRA
jgi:hypothetical protein